MSRRVTQDHIDNLLLAPERDKKALGRLFATGIFDKFEAWLDAEDRSKAETAIDVLTATIMFGAFITSGVLWEGFAPQAVPFVVKLFATSLEPIAKGEV